MPVDESDFREERVSVRRGLLRMTLHRLDNGLKWSTGGYTRLDAVVGGKLVYRSWEREWKNHSLPKLARQLLGVQP